MIRDMVHIMQSEKITEVFELNTLDSIIFLEVELELNKYRIVQRNESICARNNMNLELRP